MPGKTVIVYILANILFAFLNPVIGNPLSKTVVQTSDGLIIYPDLNFSGSTRSVRLQVISDKIIRVTASPFANFSDVKSLITVYKSLSKNFSVIKKEDRVFLKTPLITASVLLSTGAVSFTNAAGKPIVKERQYHGRSFTPTVFEGENSYGINQTFETTVDDAYYGLGQHQSDQYNYKGQQVLMFQNNTEVAVPFLVSSKNYGILWDNYSLTKVGDTRNYLPLSSLKLFSKTGNAGWLTTSYSNDRLKPDVVAFTKAESDINYPYLNDTKNGLPAGFKPQSGVISWEGSVASEFDGSHQFRFTYAGYAKVWVDGKLMLDRWRQAWNPRIRFTKPEPFKR